MYIGKTVGRLFEVCQDKCDVDSREQLAQAINVDPAALTKSARCGAIPPGVIVRLLLAVPHLTIQQIFELADITEVKSGNAK